jgi:hypothetical protein
MIDPSRHHWPRTASDWTNLAFVVGVWLGVIGVVVLVWLAVLAAALWVIG